MKQADVPDLSTHRFCGSCQRWLTAEYGSLLAPARATVFTPGALVRDIAASAAGDTSHYRFLCYDCQHKKKMRRFYLFGGLGALVAIALLVSRFVGA